MDPTLIPATIFLIAGFIAGYHIGSNHSKSMRPVEESTPRVTATQPKGNRYYPTLFLPVATDTVEIADPYNYLTRRIGGEVLHKLWGNLSISKLYRYRMLDAPFSSEEQALDFGERVLRETFQNPNLSEEQHGMKRDILI